MTDRGVFISYRRRDSSAHAGRLNDDLTKDFGLRVFMDIEDIRPGDVFTAEIESEIKSSCAMIVVIGPDWLDMVDKNGARRLDDPDDPVRRELATAFRHRIAVFPVLVGGVQPPDPERLPTDIAKLAKLNALELSDTRWSFDVQRLIDALNESMGLVPSRRKPPTWLRAHVPTPVLVVSAAALVLSTVGVARSCANAGPADRSTASTEPVDSPPLLEYGVDQCIQGFVWRGATQDDHVCVTREVYLGTLADNANREARWVYPLANPPLCIADYQWRFATATDYVCVSRGTWEQTQRDNQLAETRKQINADS